jgi:hypothetical protein
MKPLQDAKRDFYLQELSETEGNVVDLEKAWLLQEITTSISSNTTDLWKEYFIQEGHDQDNLRDQWMSFLRSEGYSGNFHDMQLRFYNDN